MSLSRAVVFLAVLVPVNLVIVSRMTGLRLRTLLPAVPGPVLSGAAAIAVAYGLRALGTDELRPLFSLLVVGGAAALAAVASCSRSSATSATPARAGRPRSPCG